MFNNFTTTNYCDENYGQQIPKQSQERILYEDILGYTNDDFNIQQEDPMTDENFLAFLSLLSEPIPSEEAIKVKRSSSSKTGHCQHPKHVIYRQEKYKLMPLSETSCIMKTIPRRGRPPKGSNECSTTTFIAELSVRPLPKRLESVVGKSNIKVCLTCLKRSDMDQEYIYNKDYIGPQQSHKKKG